MALFDSADLLARAKRMALRPTSDEETSDTDWYALLTEAQLYWVTQIALYVPDVMYTLELLTTSDSGVSYQFSTEPLGNYELRASPTGRLLVPTPEWDMGGDFVMDGINIRFPGSRAKTFSNGPWARYVKTPGIIDGSTQPTMKPTMARILLPARACVLWATRGGLRDPQPFLNEENGLWFGNGQTHTGILGALKNQAFLQGAAAVPASGGDDWWRFIDTGSGYVSGGG